MTRLKVLVWQWGRRGAGPRFAAELAASLAEGADTASLLSLSAQSELLLTRPAPQVALSYPTYVGLPGFIRRMASIPWLLPRLIRTLRDLAPDVAICAMPAPLDMLMGSALRRLGIPFFVVVHDADAHPGDGFPLQMTLQRRLVRRAAGIVTLSDHVARRLAERGEIGERVAIAAWHPPFAFGPKPPQPRVHGGPLRLLFFGRLLPYKGLDLFAASVGSLGPRDDIEIRVVGQGPETAALQALRDLPGVTVENRWVPEAEVADLLAWSDAIVLSHTEASQSGVASAAVAAGRWLVATEVGGLVEQLQHVPTARMCPPTPPGLAAAIASLITDPPAPASTEHDAERSWQAMAASVAAGIRTSIGR